MTKGCGVSYYHLSKSNDAMLKHPPATETAIPKAVYKTWANKPLEKITEMVYQSRNRKRVTCRRCRKSCNNLSKHVREYHMQSHGGGSERAINPIRQIDDQP